MASTENLITVSGTERSFLSNIERKQLLDVQKGTLRYTWRGVPCLKNPFDLALYPMLLWELKPATIIEVGAKFGGSALWLDDLCVRFGIKTKIVCIDIDTERFTVKRQNISLHHGDGRDLAATLTPELVATLPHPWMVIEDADHHFITTMAVLEFMATQMVRGDYLLVEDGVSVTFETADKPQFEGGPSRAVAEFLKRKPAAFDVETRFCDFFGTNVTWNPNGYLRKT